MKNKFSTIYTIFASAIFIFAIFYFGFNLYSEYSDGYLRTKKIFDELSLSLKENPNNIKISNLNDYAYIEISKNENQIYVYPSSEAKNNSSPLVKNWFSTQQIDDSNYFITADMYLLRPSSIRFYAKNSFIVVFIVTIITIIMLITISINEKKNLNNKQNEKNDDEIKLDDLSSENSSDFNLENDENFELETTLSLNENTSFTENENQEIQNESQNLQQNLENDENISLPSEEIKPEKIEINDNNPYGLYSPKTGLCWESYLLTRLTNELNRAISSELELAVFIFRIENLENDNEKLKNICDYLISQFQFKDMLFEYKDDCIVALKTSLNLDDAISFADKLHSDIEDISALKCFIGISTRTIRIITAERLLQEADEALKHAQEENDTPIIAFRANAEKYREFIENK